VEHDPKAEDAGMVLVEVYLLGHRMLVLPLALEDAVAHQMQDAVLGWGKVCRACSANYRSTVFVWTSRRPTAEADMAGRPDVKGHAGPGLQMGAFDMQEVPYQEPAEDQLVSMAETGSQDSQTLQYAAG
jgi:hypothetical protein